MNAIRWAIRACRPKGVALISALMLLLVIMLLAVGMMRSFGLQERIAGSTREKQRAFHAAQSALQFGESWLGNKNWGVGTRCSAAAAPVLAQIQVCSNALADVTTLPWNPRVEYQPAGMSVKSGGGLDARQSDINYYAAPGLYINYIGLSSDSLSMLYSVTAYGYAANADDVSVVQSTYVVTSDQTRDLTAP